MIKLSAKTIKIFKTCNLYCCFFGLGLCVAVIGPTLIDLTHIVNSNIKDLAFIYTARSIGHLIGSIAGGVLLDMIKRKQILLAIFSFTTTVTIIVIPWSRQIITLTVWMGLNGLSLSILNIGGNVYCLNLWGEDNGPFYQALHFIYGCGGLVAPLVAAPFLEDYNASSEVSNNTTNVTTGQNNVSMTLQKEVTNSSFIGYSTIPSVTYAYISIGLFCSFVTILFLCMFILSPSDVDGAKRSTSDFSDRSWLATSSLVLLTSLLIFTAMGTEIGYAQMLTTYATKGPLHLLTTTGSYMTSAYWAAYTISRLTSICLAIKFSQLTMLVFDVFLTSIGSICLLLLAPHFEWGLWVTSILLGVGIASFFPSSISWLDKYIPVTNKILAIISIGQFFAEMIIPSIISYFMEEFPYVFQFVHLTCSVMAIVLTTTMYLLVRRMSDRFMSQEGVTNSAYN